ncbi:hypothetical protein PMZ80_003926 [Knufia obscura]|uniref:Uncharacterized protein n=2 Tax=Knufia TaxID=430999 RepID=A0AAN8I6V0_9EURO|nr:hypothetical protein PMZ80_003926 [Knufia obscura]KAK5952341.1 hypothetical protein OHC33_006814 [Knufia fluminis]
MDDSNNAGAPPSPTQRRKSFVEMLNPRAFGNSTTSSASMSTSPSNAVPSAPGASNNGRKSMSMALGLQGSGNSQESPYNAFSRQRRASMSASSASGSDFRNSFDENAVIEEDDKIGPMNSPPSPSLARRLSFGAQALRDVRQGGTSPTNNAGRRPSYSLFTLSEDANADNKHPKSNSRSPGTAKTGGEGFNWSEAMRDRNKRASIGSNPFSPGHGRSKSFNAPAAEPPREMPTQPPPAPAARPPGAKIKKPDHLGERMLRGEFMMD